MWIELLLLAIGVLYALNRWALNYWKRRGVFQLEPQFLFGNTKELFFQKRLMQDYIHEVYKKYKHHKLVGLYGFYKPILLVTDPELVKTVMIKDFNSFAGAVANISEKVDPLMGVNPFVSHDLEQWKERRGLHVGSLTPGKLKTLPELAVKIGENMADFIKKKKSSPIRIKQLTDYLALDTICLYGFGVEPTAFTDPENGFLKYASDTLFREDFARSFTSSIIYPFTSLIYSLRIISADSEDFFVKMTKQLKEYRMKNQTNRSDFLDNLIKTNARHIQEGKKGFTDLEFAGHCFTAYLDSFFTISSELGFFILDLSNNPEVQEKIREEILTVGSKVQDFDYDKIHSIQTLDYALKESLRYRSPVPVSGRTCVKDTELGGVKIDKGTRILLPFQTLHMDPDYFPEPDKYKPDRFQSPDALVKGTYLPFGDGPRMCLGMKYAQLVIKTYIIHILLNFKILPGAQLENSQISNLNVPNEEATVSFEPIVNN